MVRGGNREMICYGLGILRLVLVPDFESETTHIHTIDTATRPCRGTRNWEGSI